MCAVLSLPSVLVEPARVSVSGHSGSEVSWVAYSGVRAKRTSRDRVTATRRFSHAPAPCFARSVAGVGEWWEGAVCYQIYPRSFADSDGDGIGDLAGITAHLDHLEWLGIDAIWLSPTFPSPNADWGYDVADYFGVHPDLGTSADLDELIAAARTRGIRILLDLVPNHTSIEHPWFVDSRSSRDAEHRDWYVWADPAADGGPPNNWVSSFMGKAWTLDEATGQMYLTNFLPEQADLNWWNDDVRDAFDAILRFWFDRGVAGFRIDVAHMIVKDRDLRDNPPASADDPLLAQLRGQRAVYNSNRPEVHDVHRHWRRIADEYDPPRLLVGETFVDSVEELIPFYGEGDELGLAFNIPFLQAPFDASTLRALVETTESLVPDGCAPVWTGSNHDVSRLPTRWAAGNDAATRCALMMLLTLRGTAFLYYGDELGMPDTDVPAIGSSTPSASSSLRCTTVTRRVLRCTGATRPARASRR